MKFCHQLDGKHFEVRPATQSERRRRPRRGRRHRNRPAGDLDALLTGAPARAPAFQPSAARPAATKCRRRAVPCLRAAAAEFRPEGRGRDFQGGRCTRGDSCKYVHAAPGAPPPPGLNASRCRRERHLAVADGRCARRAASTSTRSRRAAATDWMPPPPCPPRSGQERRQAGRPSAGRRGFRLRRGAQQRRPGWRPPDVGPPLGGG